MAEEDFNAIMARPLRQFDIVADMADFIRQSESSRQQAANSVMQSQAARPQFIDYSEPVQLDMSPPVVQSSSESQDDIELGGNNGNGDDAARDWFVSATGDNEEGIKTWLMKGGKVYDVTTGTITVVPDTALTGNTGEVYLLIERDLGTRAITEIIPTLDTITPESFNQLQYKRIARLEEVTLEGAELPSFTRPIQVQFGDIMLWEELVVVNGAFKLMTFNAAIGNTYDA
jgi:hypothetical protein